jgi:hypothetical protein
MHYRNKSKILIKLFILRPEQNFTPPETLAVPPNVAAIAVFTTPLTFGLYEPPSEDMLRQVIFQQLRYIFL